LLGIGLGIGFWGEGGRERGKGEGKCLPCCHVAFPAAVFVGLLFYFCFCVNLHLEIGEWDVKMDEKRWDIPSVTFSFSFGSVGFPFAEGMVSSISFSINSCWLFK
jgi:hypothetical protein